MAGGDDGNLKAVMKKRFSEIRHRPTDLRMQVNARDARQRTHLHLASFEGELHAVVMAITMGANVNAKDDTLSTPLHLACKRGHLAIVRILMIHGANPYLCDNKHHNALYISCRAGHMAVVRFLLQRDSTPETRKRALIPAIEGGTPQMVLYIIGMAPRIKVPPEAMAHACLHIPSPLMLQALIQSGGDVNGTVNGESPLHECMGQKCSKVKVQMLLDAGANMEARNFAGATPLFTACHSQNVEVIDLLAERGANVNATRHGYYLLHDVVFGQDTDIVKALLKHKPIIDVRDQNGATPLHCACERRKSDIVEALLKNGADPNIGLYEFRKHDKFPLFNAIKRGNSRMVKLLFEHGARVNDLGDLKALLIAASGQKRYGDMRLLIQHGPPISDEDKHVIKNWAIARGSQALADLLEEGQASGK